MNVMHLDGPRAATIACRDGEVSPRIPRTSIREQVTCRKCLAQIPRMGRPLIGSEKRRAYNVMLEPSVAARLREYGDGNLSAGIARAEAKTRP